MRKKFCALLWFVLPIVVMQSAYSSVYYKKEDEVTAQVIPVRCKPLNVIITKSLPNAGVFVGKDLIGKTNGLGSFKHALPCITQGETTITLKDNQKASWKFNHVHANYYIQCYGEPKLCCIYSDEVLMEKELRENCEALQ